MTLPKRNPLLWTLYILLVISMFVFMATVSYMGLPEEGNFNTVTVQEAQADYSYPEDSNAVINKMNGITDMPEITLVVKPYPTKITLNNNLDAVINRVWEEFYSDQTIHQFAEQERTVYALYSDYDSSSNTMEVALGYRINNKAKHSSMHYVTLSAGQYYQAESIVDGWQQAANLPITFTFENDFEIYQLDNQYKVISQQAFIGIQ